MSHIIKSLPCKFTNISEIGHEDRTGTLSGYASVFNITDECNDVILRGAFIDSVEKHREMNNIKLLWQHRPEQPIGVITGLNEDTHGLYMQAKLLLDVRQAQEAYNLIKAGAINGLSIGFSIVDSYRQNEKRIITKLNLWEVSLVTFPANELAVLSEVKSGNGEIASLNDAINRAINALSLPSLWC